MDFSFVREQLEKQPGCDLEWIDKYLHFLESAPAGGDSWTHHGLPVAAFPAFESDERNLIPLRHRDHFCAHFLLCRALPRNLDVCVGFYRMAADVFCCVDKVNELADAYPEVVKSRVQCHWNRIRRTNEQYTVNMGDTFLWGGMADSPRDAVYKTKRHIQSGEMDCIFHSWVKYTVTAEGAITEMVDISLNREELLATPVNEFEVHTFGAPYDGLSGDLIR
jgi:hypothetical protein